jgi:hypothetical protein
MLLTERRWQEIAETLDGEFRPRESAIVSRSRVSPWKVDVPSSPSRRLTSWRRTRLTAFGEASGRPMVIYRDSLPLNLRPEPLSPQHTGWKVRTPPGHYSLSQFMVEVAPAWSAAESRAAIMVTDHGAADWMVVAREHVAAGWEQRVPSLDQLKLAIATLTQLTALPKSRLPFR